MKHFYTFIMDYLGGIYVSQVEAEDNIQAIKVWIESLALDEIEGFTKKDQEKALKDEVVFEPALLTGLTNVWCTGVRTGKGYASVNFVKTDRS